MKEATLETRLEQIERQVAEIREMLTEERLQREAIRDLQKDMGLVLREAMKTGTEKLQALEPRVEAADLSELLIKLLQNVHNLNRLLDGLESLMELSEEMGPLSREAMRKLSEKLAELDEKGYFEFFAEVLGIVDTIVTSFSVEDVRLLREHITSILITVKNLTQPEMLATINNALNFYRRMEIEIEKEVTFGRLFRELRDPQTRRGLAFMIEFMKRMVSPTNGQPESLPMNPQH